MKSIYSTHTLSPHTLPAWRWLIVGVACLLPLMLLFVSLKAVNAGAQRALFSSDEEGKVNPPAEALPAVRQVLDHDVLEPSAANQRSSQLTVYVTNGSQAEVWVGEYNGTLRRQQIVPPQAAVFEDLLIGHQYWLQAWPVGAEIPALANSPRQMVTIGTEPQVFTLTLQSPNVVGSVADPLFQSLPPVLGDPPYPAWLRVMALNVSDMFMAPTNDLGQFSMALPHGSYSLIAKPNDTNSITWTQSLPLSFTLSTALPFHNLGVVRVTYPSIRGRVYDPLGDTILTQVYGWSQDGSYSQYSASDIGPGNLFYQFGGMPTGQNYVQALPPSINPLHYSPSEVHAFMMFTGTQYEIGAMQTYTLTLKAANFIGKLQYPPSYSACPGCVVPGVDVFLHASSLGYTAWTSSDAAGEFFFGGLQPGTYVLQFFLPDALQFDWEVPFGPDNIFELVTTTDVISRVYDLQAITPTKWLSGYVMLQGDGAVADAWVLAYQFNSGQRKMTSTDANGRYEMSLGPGLWYVWVQSNNAASGWYFDQSWGQWLQFSSEPAEVEMRSVDFTVMPAVYYLVEGSVLDEAFNPPPYHSVTVRLCRDEGGCFSTLVEDGGYFAVSVLAGSYRLWLSVDPNIGLLPPLDNGAFIDVFADRTLEPLFLRPAASRSAWLNGRVVNIATGLGLGGVVVQAWTDSGDWVTTTTAADGYYNLALTPGEWRASLLLNNAQASYWFVWPPQVREGRLQAGQIASDVNFMAHYRDSTLQGFLTNELGDPLTDTVATVYAYSCNPTHCWLVDARRAMGGYFNLRVPGNMTYTLNAWLPSGSDYLSGGSVVVPLSMAQTVTDVHLTLQTAASRIHGRLLDRAKGAVEARAEVFAVQDHQWVQDSLWPGKDPYEFNLRVPLPFTDTHWTIGLWVDPSSGYVADPTTGLYDVLLTAGMTETQPISLYVRRLDALITGSVTLDGAPAPYVRVYARGRAGSAEWGLSFEGVSGPDGTFTISVPSGSYWVGAYVPAEMSSLYFAPSPLAWNGPASNPLHLAFIRRDAALISGALSVTPASAISPTAVVHVFGTSRLGYVEVTATLAGGYHLPVASNTRWTIWAAYEDPVADAYYLSQKIILDVLTGTLSAINLALEAAPEALPDTLCWSFDAARLMRLNLPSSGNQPAALVTIPAGAFPVDGQVTVCATPHAAMPGGEAFIGFAYDLEARDSQGNLITEEFDQPIRISFLVPAEQLPAAADAHSLQVMFYSPLRQAWVALENLYFNPATGWLSGATRHFTKFGVRGSFGEESYRLYLPVVSLEGYSR